MMDLQSLLVQTLAAHMKNLDSLTNVCAAQADPRTTQKKNRLKPKAIQQFENLSFHTMTQSRNPKAHTPYVPSSTDTLVSTIGRHPSLSQTCAQSVTLKTHTNENLTLSERNLDATTRRFCTETSLSKMLWDRAVHLLMINRRLDKVQSA